MHSGTLHIFGRWVGFLMIFWLNMQVIQAQEIEYEEIPVYLAVENLGYFEMEALYGNDELLLPSWDMLRKLQIFANASPAFDTVSGFFARPEAQFVICYPCKQIIMTKDTIKAGPGQMVANDYDLFVATALLEKAFGLTLRFDFRSLTVYLSSDTELPVIKMMRLEKIRENIRKVNGEILADTTLKRKPHFYRGGFADWSVSTKHQNSDLPLTTARMALGSEFLGGELTLRLSQSSSEAFDVLQQSGRWRWTFPEGSWLTQTDVSIQSAPTYTRITAPVAGFSISNAPLVFRKSFGTYTLQGKTEPGWEVEAYVNDVLIDYTTADANGEYTFSIPMIYGSTRVVLRKYGPWGEEETEEQIMTIPFQFTPVGHFDYQLNGGLTFDSLHVPYTFARINYGVSRRMTVSGGFEHYAGSTLTPNLPFTSASFVVSKNLLLGFTILGTAWQQADVTYRTRNGFSIESNMIHYSDEQDALPGAPKSTLSSAMTIPAHVGKTRILLKGTHQMLEGVQQTTHSVGNAISVYYRRFNMVAFMQTALSSRSPSSSGGLNTSMTFKRQWTMMTQLSGNISEKTLNTARIQIQKRFSGKLYGSVSGQYQFESKQVSVSSGLFVSLQPFRAGYTNDAGRNSYSGNLELNGSIMWGSAVAPIAFGSRAMAGRCGIEAVVFLDINHNGTKEKSEPIVPGVTVGISKGQQMRTAGDSVYRFMSLDPGTIYILSVSEGGLQSISWVVPFKTIAVRPDPNQIRQVYIPILPMGEVSGYAILQSNGKELPLRKMQIEIVDSLGNVVAVTRSEDDGFFSHLGLAPGTYRLRFNQAQLLNQHAVQPDEPRFVIREIREGDYCGDITLKAVTTE